MFWNRFYFYFLFSLLYNLNPEPAVGGFIGCSLAGSETVLFAFREDYYIVTLLAHTLAIWSNGAFFILVTKIIHLACAIKIHRLFRTSRYNIWNILRHPRLRLSSCCPFATFFKETHPAEETRNNACPNHRWRVVEGGATFFTSTEYVGYSLSWPFSRSAVANLLSKRYVTIYHFWSVYFHLLPFSIDDIFSSISAEQSTSPGDVGKAQYQPESALNAGSNRWHNECAQLLDSGMVFGTWRREHKKSFVAAWDTQVRKSSFTPAVAEAVP